MTDLISWIKEPQETPFFILGPCAMEGRQFTLEAAAEIKLIAQNLGINAIFKSSFDKANRTSGSSKRGVGLDKGLDILNEVRESTGLPVITDIHTEEQATIAGDVVDAIQIPAFLCRQTDIIVAAAQTGKVVNIKKGQFLAPADMKNVQQKAIDAGAQIERVWLCERGTTFGYGNLVVDMRGLEIMRQSGSPVVFDATHSVQLPGAGGNQSGGQREFVPALGRAALSVGVNGVFVETHPDPQNAVSDGPNMWPLQDLARLLRHWLEIAEGASRVRTEYKFT